MGRRSRDAVVRGFDAAAAVPGELRRNLPRQRQAVIAAHPERRERELDKMADDVAAAVAATIRSRGVGEPQAALTAEAGMTVLRVAVQEWAAGGDERDLAPIVQDSAASGAPWRPAPEAADPSRGPAAGT